MNLDYKVLSVKLRHIQIEQPEKGEEEQCMQPNRRIRNNDSLHTLSIRLWLIVTFGWTTRGMEQGKNTHSPWLHAVLLG